MWNANCEIHNYYYSIIESSSIIITSHQKKYFSSKLISFITHIFRIPVMNNDHNSQSAQ